MRRGHCPLHGDSAASHTFPTAGTATATRAPCWYTPRGDGRMASDQMRRTTYDTMSDFDPHGESESRSEYGEILMHPDEAKAIFRTEMTRQILTRGIAVENMQP